jgi:RHS repeat-associated protein
LSQVTDYSLADKGFKYQNTRTVHSDPDYRYDDNGNLIWDRHKNITSIEYHYLNLPLKIVIVKPNDVLNSGSIEFVYDATGVKLRKMIKDNAGIVKETRDYVNGVEYKNRILQRVAHSEGAVVQNDLGAYQHEYVLRDHLGNTRVTFRDGINKGEPYDDWSNGWFPILVNPNANNPSYNDGVVTKEDIVQINNYYPFGLNMEGDWNGAPGNNKYQYNGKEWNDDFGLGWNDYGKRFYDPAIGRWAGVDSLAEHTFQLDKSPYAYAWNNPVNLTDPDGHCPACAIIEGGVALYRLYKLQRVAGRVAKAVGINLKTPQASESVQMLAEIQRSQIISDATAVARPILIELSKKDKEKQKEKEAAKEEKKQKEAEEKGVDLEDPTANQVVPGSLQKSKSWHEKLADTPLSELNAAAKKGDQKAADMAKLIEQRERLLEKIKNSQKKN